MTSVSIKIKLKIIKTRYNKTMIIISFRKKTYVRYQVLMMNGYRFGE